MYGIEMNYHMTLYLLVYFAIFVCIALVGYILVELKDKKSLDLWGRWWKEVENKEKLYRLWWSQGGHRMWVCAPPRNDKIGWCYSSDKNQAMLATEKEKDRFFFESIKAGRTFGKEVVEVVGAKEVVE